MKNFIREVVFSVILSLFLIFILSLIISKTSVPEGIINPAIIVISTISVTIGGIRISKARKEKGIINGAIIGMIYMISMYLISSFIFKDFSLSIKSLIMIISGIIGGAIGGIIGVNF